MSLRQRVLATVVALCERRSRPVTLPEIAESFPRGTGPINLDAVCGSLVRTRHLAASPARQWPRETRNAYQPWGWNLAVDYNATRPSRGEVVGRAILQIWNDPQRENTPITSREIRAFLDRNGLMPELRGQPSLLPTLLNQLRKASVGSQPLVAAVQLPGVRAQMWVPFGAEWVRPESAGRMQTHSDRIVAMVREVMATRQLVLFTLSDLQRTTTGGLGNSVVLQTLARDLADVTRPVQSTARRRVPRRKPHLVHLGEVDGRAHYTTPESLTPQDESSLSPAMAEFGWRRLLEEWELSRLGVEVEELRKRGQGGHLVPDRWALAQPRVQGFRERAATLARVSPGTVMEGCTATTCLAAINAASGVVCGLAPAAIHTTALIEDTQWYGTRDAVSRLRSDFGIERIPSHVIQSFMQQEVVRRRSINYVGRVGQRGQFQCKWDYDEVSLRYAGAIRWGSPQVALLVRQGLHHLGPLRNYELVATRVSAAEWSVPDVAAVFGLLCDSRALPILDTLLDDTLLDAHRRWVRLARALVSWSPHDGSPSPWRNGTT